MLQWPSFNYSLITNKTLNVTSTYSYKINFLRPLEGIPYIVILIIFILNYKYLIVMDHGMY